jgi:hypothetical protein
MVYETNKYNSIEDRIRTLKSTSTRYGTIVGRDEQKIMHPGQLDHFRGRLGKGPGAYEKTDITVPKCYTKAGVSPIGRSDRGLLTIKKDAVPGPGQYDNDTIKVK